MLNILPDRRNYNTEHGGVSGGCWSCNLAYGTVLIMKRGFLILIRSVKGKKPL